MTVEEVDRIKRLVDEVYGPEAVVWLFGSQLDDSARGGDVDLLVEVPQDGSRELGPELRLHRRLEEALGERKVDLIVHHRGDREEPFVRIAKTEGVIL